QMGLHPRASYLRGFVANLQRDPRAGVLDIINWAPHGMSTGNAPRETTMDLIRKGRDPNYKERERENLAGMTLEQRVKFIIGLIADGQVLDEVMIIWIFASAPTSQRAGVYKGVEGHAWTGDFKRGDRLYRLLSNERVKRLKNIVNGLSPE